MSDVIRQQQWTEDALKRAGFERYERKKTLVMARILPASEAPKTIISAHGERMVASAGYRICYAPSASVYEQLDEYEQWAVDPDIFNKTYKAWDEADWTPSPSEAKLMALGCRPYYKAEGVWAKKLAHDIYMQSLESPSPTLVSSGRVLAIGVDGEPYAMLESEFEKRYHPARISLIQRLVKYFKPR